MLFRDFGGTKRHTFVILPDSHPIRRRSVNLAFHCCTCVWSTSHPRSVATKRETSMLLFAWRRHLYRDGNRCSHCPALKIRCEGKFVVMPPSIESNPKRNRDDHYEAHTTSEIYAQTKAKGPSYRGTGFTPSHWKLFVLSAEQYAVTVLLVSERVKRAQPYSPASFPPYADSFPRPSLLYSYQVGWVASYSSSVAVVVTGSLQAIEFAWLGVV